VAENQLATIQLFELPIADNKNARSQYRIYKSYLSANGQHILRPNLAAYRDWLVEKKSLAPSSLSAYLSTIRSAYRRLILSKDFRKQVFEVGHRNRLSGVELKQFVEEVTIRISNAINPIYAPVSSRVRQDIPDAAHIMLTKSQAKRLLESPNPGTKAGLRDMALLSMLICTGVRAFEVCNLQVDDLKQTINGNLALYIREGKQNKSRFVPYGGLDFCLVIVDRWLEVSGITEGYVFRGLYKSGRLREGKLSERSVGDILAKYPISIRGLKTTLKPHDLRRTYAKLCWENSMKTEAIQQNLGHANIQTTLGYIGPVDIEHRMAKSFIKFELTLLEIEKQLNTD